jgi:hypothetical protein
MSEPQAPGQAIRSAVGTPEAAVERVEQLALGEAFAAPAKEASDAIAVLRARAIAALFPSEVQPIDAGAFGALEFFSRAFPRTVGHAAQMAALHGRSLRSHPALATLIRTPEVCRAVGAAEAGQAFVMARDPKEMAGLGIAGFEVSIARQLVAAGHELAPAAQDLVDATELAVRVAAATAKQAAHASSIVAEAAAARQAAERARAQEADRAAAEADRAVAELERELRRVRERARRLRAGEVDAQGTVGRLDKVNQAGEVKPRNATERSPA